MLDLFGNVGGAGTGSNEIPVNGVNFDSSNDYLTEAAVSGAVDGKQLLWSIWLKRTALGNRMDLINFDNTTTKHISLLSDDTIECALADSGGTIRAHQTGGTLTDITGWHHLMGSFDLGTAGRRWIFLDDVDVTTEVVHTDATIDFTVNYAVGAKFTGSSKFDGDMAQVYLSLEYLDLSIENNRRKLVSANIKPVDMGSDGSLVTGTAPLIFLTGPTVNWHLNAGSGDGFAENGALTDSATDPSD